jgi:hypothetical protein
MKAVVTTPTLSLTSFRHHKEVCFTDLGKINWWFDLKHEPIFATAPVASKNDTRYKNGQNRLKNNHLAVSI